MATANTKDAELLSRLTEDVDREQKDCKSLPETISLLNIIRKEMIELVFFIPNIYE